MTLATDVALCQGQAVIAWIGRRLDRSDALGRLMDPVPSVAALVVLSPLDCDPAIGVRLRLTGRSRSGRCVSVGMGFHSRS